MFWTFTLTASTFNPVIASTVFLTFSWTKLITSGIFIPYSTATVNSIVAASSPKVTFTLFPVVVFLPFRIWDILLPTPVGISTIPSSIRRTFFVDGVAPHFFGKVKVKNHCFRL